MPLRSRRLLVALSVPILVGAAWAQPAGGPAGAEANASGEVRRVDRAAGKLTLRHGEIPHLDMPPMTMVFRVRDGAMLEGLKEGDRVRFRAEKDGSQYVVTRLERE